MHRPMDIKFLFSVIRVWFASKHVSLMIAECVRKMIGIEALLFEPLESVTYSYIRSKK
jgi:hypothetical protein